MNLTCTNDEVSLKNFHTFLLRRREAILGEWSANPNILELVARLSLSLDEHRSSIAVPVLDNLIQMLSRQDSSPDCPIMRELVEAFYNRGLTVEDVFLNCTGLKNAIISLLFTGEEKNIAIDHVMEILDQNLYRVLSVYTEKLREREKELHVHNRIIEEHVVLTITDTKGKIIHVTDAFCELTGFSKEELLGSDHSLIRHPDMKDALFKGMWKCIQTGRVWHGKIKNLKKGGGEFIASTEIIPVQNDAGEIIEYMAIRNDITDKELSSLDSLTGLYNRRKFDALLAEHFTQDASLSLLIVDIDHFKTINDTFGHQQGDTVLKCFAKILLEHLRDGDICARWGGEEFVILLPDTPADAALSIAERIRKTTETAQILENHPIRCSIGLTDRSGEDTVDSLFERADRLLYRAKQNGRNQTVTA